MKNNEGSNAIEVACQTDRVKTMKYLMRSKNRSRMKIISSLGPPHTWEYSDKMIVSSILSSDYYIVANFHMSCERIYLM
jgi:hypothetical protein